MPLPRLIPCLDVAGGRVVKGVRFAELRDVGDPAELGAAYSEAGADELVFLDVAATVEDAMEGADAVMALRIQRERMEQSLIPSAREYARVWGVNAERVELMKPEAVVMHPGPFNRDVEITSDVVDGPRSVIWRQVENGAAVRCAVLERCARARRDGESARSPSLAGMRG